MIFHRHRSRHCPPVVGPLVLVQQRKQVVPEVGRHRVVGGVDERELLDVLLDGVGQPGVLAGPDPAWLEQAYREVSA